MPGTSTKTEQVTVRLPVDLLEWIKTQDGSKAEIIARSIMTQMTVGPVATPDPRIAELEAEIARLKRDFAAASLSPTQARTILKPADGGKSTDVVRYHPAGPVLEATGMRVGGMARGFNLKGGGKG